MKDLTLGFKDIYTISGRGTVIMVDLDDVPNVEKVQIDENIKVKDKFYKIRGVEIQRVGTLVGSYIGLLVREIEDPTDFIEFLCLDVGRTHKGNENCSMRLAQHPNGSWYCIDCGLTICCKSIKTKEIKDKTNDSTSMDKR